MKSLRLAIGFLTVLPVAPVHSGPMGPARAYFPLVGLGIGGLLAGLDIAASQVLPPPVVGALLVAALLVLTRAIHTEGFLDACDGLWGGHDREARLAILRDSHVGAFAVVGGVEPLATEVDARGRHSGRGTNCPPGSLPLPLALRNGHHDGRVSLCPSAGIGHGVSGRIQLASTRVRLCHGRGCRWLLLGIAGLLLLVCATGLALGLGWWFRRMLGGMTGDTYGATNEVAEVTVLLLGVILIRTAPTLVDAPFW